MQGALLSQMLHHICSELFSSWSKSLSYSGCIGFPRQSSTRLSSFNLDTLFLGVHITSAEVWWISKIRLILGQCPTGWPSFTRTMSPFAGDGPASPNALECHVRWSMRRRFFSWFTMAVWWADSLLRVFSRSLAPLFVMFNDNSRGWRALTPIRWHGAKGESGW